MPKHVDPSEVVQCDPPKSKLFVNLSGKRYGRLLVGKFFGRKVYNGKGRYYYNCLCDCGTSVLVSGYAMSVAGTVSCGCFQAQRMSEEITTHGKCGIPEYRTWAGMIQRCHNPENPSYENYGLRGIFVCDRWRNSFDFFLEDMGVKPSKLHTIERVDNSLGYSPENCVWATRLVQNRNTRQTRFITFLNETKCASEWEEEFGLPRGILSARLNAGWSVCEAIISPVGPSSVRYKNK